MSTNIFMIVICKYKVICKEPSSLNLTGFVSVWQEIIEFAILVPAACSGTQVSGSKLWNHQDLSGSHFPHLLHGITTINQ